MSTEMQIFVRKLITRINSSQNVQTVCRTGRFCLFSRRQTELLRSARSSECVVACARVLPRNVVVCACACRGLSPLVRVLRRIGIKFTRHPDILFRPTDCKRILQSPVFFPNFVVQLFQICGITLIARRLRRNFAHNCVFHSPLIRITRSSPGIGYIDYLYFSIFFFLSFFGIICFASLVRKYILSLFLSVCLCCDSALIFFRLIFFLLLFEYIGTASRK